MKVYLGDSVYAETGSFVGEIILTTDNGEGPSNTICMEPQVIEAFQQFAKRITQTTEDHSSTGG